LFVADVPINLNEEDFANLFSQQDGYVASRIREDKNQNRVGFVDYDTAQNASAAKQRFHGHKFGGLPEPEPGLNIHFSKQRDNRGKRNRELYAEDRFSANRTSGGSTHYSGPHPMFGASPYEKNSSSFPPYGMPSNPFPAPYGSHMQNASMYPPLPPDASATLYVEGLPNDATDREVSHIFRPFTGYSSVRILQKESKAYPTRTYALCFVEFDNKYQATVAMHALQGYRMDKNDTKGLTISYAKSDRKERRRPERAGEKGAQGADRDQASFV
jgi:RNA recognition motif-containing protein